MNNKVNSKALFKRVFALIAAAVLVLSLFTLSACGKGEANGGESLSDSATENKSEIKVNFKIVYEDGNEKTVELKTKKTILADALVEAGIIEYNSDGLYTTIDGITADFSKDGAWWCITKDGQMTNYGLNDLKIADGETYEATYTK